MRGDVVKRDREVKGKDMGKRCMRVEGWNIGRWEGEKLRRKEVE